MTVEEYLEFEEKSAVKHEFIDGELFLMAGGSINHNRIVGNTFASLHSTQRGKNCEVFGSDLRLNFEMFDLYTYPDVMVICSRPETILGRQDTETNPLAIGEVLSPTTHDYDKTTKFAYYRSIPFLKDYVLIDQSRHHVEYYHKIKTGGNCSGSFVDQASGLKVQA